MGGDVSVDVSGMANVRSGMVAESSERSLLGNKNKKQKSRVGVWEDSEQEMDGNGMKALEREKSFPFSIYSSPCNFSLSSFYNFSFLFLAPFQPFSQLRLLLSELLSLFSCTVFIIYFTNSPFEERRLSDPFERERVRERVVEGN